MTDTEKLKLINHMIIDFWECDSGEKLNYETLVNCIISVIDFQEGKK